MSAEDKSSVPTSLNLVTSEQDRSHSIDTNLPEGLGPFFDAVLGKSVVVLRNGFTTNSPGGTFTRVLTRSPRYVFEVEMSRMKQEVPYDCSLVWARTPSQVDIHGPYSFASFIRRNRETGRDETLASKTGGLYGNDMTDSEKEDFEREYLKSQVDVALTKQLYEYYVGLFGDHKNTKIEWPSQGIGIMAE